MEFDEAKNIAADYGAVLEVGSPTGGATYPISSLPHSIEEVKNPASRPSAIAPGLERRACLATRDRTVSIGYPLVFCLVSRCI